MVQQKLFHNFRRFRIYDLSAHTLNEQHLLVRESYRVGTCHCVVQKGWI